MCDVKKQISLYIHIPFCKAKCYYCDFNSFACMTDLIEPYFNALYREIETYAERLEDHAIKTVFIGGGTPSLVDARYISTAIELCSRHYKISEHAEVTMEANPGTLSIDKLRDYRSMGINRLSIGLQACQDRILKSIGRIHRYGEFVENFEQARKVGFSNINVDLIFGLPSQTLEDWDETLEKVVETGTKHISCYSLSIEEDTVFGEKLKTGEIEPVSDELDRRMYYLAKEKLGQAGYRHYEISNFARKGYECRHNLTYWKSEEYVGLGAGAHSYMNSFRYNNIYSIDGYIACISDGDLPVENQQAIDIKEKMSEFIILGLRLTDGISATEFEQKFGKALKDLFGDKIEKLRKRGLITCCGDRIMLTSQGLDLANQVFVEFI